MAKSPVPIAAVLRKYEGDVLKEWIEGLKSGGARGNTRVSEAELQSQAKDFLSLLQQATQSGESYRETATWQRDSRGEARRG